MRRSSIQFAALVWLAMVRIVAADDGRLALRTEADAAGLPVLSITAPWNALRVASLQVAWLAADAKTDELRPMPIDPASAVASWKQELAGLGKPLHRDSSQRVTTSVGFLEYEPTKLLRLRGRQNALGVWAVYGVEEPAGTRLVIYQLESWSQRGGVVRIALADLDMAPRFRQQGQLVVWLLDQTKVVAQASIAWPGDGSKPPAVVSTPKPLEPPVVVPPSRTDVESPRAKTAEPAATAGPAMSPPVAAAPADRAENPPAPAASSVTPPAAPAVIVVKPQPLQPAKVEPQAAPPAQTAETTEAAPPRKRMEDMTIDELTDHIERTWGGSMSKAVRKPWVGAWRYYYQVENPDSVRREIFLTLLRTCMKEQAEGDLRDAFGVLASKLRGRS